MGPFLDAMMATIGGIFAPIIAFIIFLIVIWVIFSLA